MSKILTTLHTMFKDHCIDMIFVQKYGIQVIIHLLVLPPKILLTYTTQVIEVPKYLTPP